MIFKKFEEIKLNKSRIVGICISTWLMSIFYPEVITSVLFFNILFISLFAIEGDKNV